ncbi:hypothetical protein PO909_003026 [Leuciscus waleckii]
MRTTLCTLVFLSSLPWSLNGHLATSNKNIEATNTADNASGQINYTTDSGTDNVVSLSRSAQTQHLTNHSGQRSIWQRTPNGDAKTSNQSKSMNIRDGESNLTTTLAQPERQRQEEVTTPQKEIRKPTEGSRRPHSTSLLQIENAEELNVLTKPPNATKPTKTLAITKKKPPSKDFRKANPGPAVAAVIGTTFVLMFIAIIFILLKKRKMQRKRLENPEWAGPSPFLDGDVQPNLPNMEESETINRQGFNQGSISRYLPQQLSKHLPLGRNTSEEVLMGDILQGSTFGRQNPDEVQDPNRNPTVAQDSTEKEENKIQEGQASLDSLDTKTSASRSAQEPVMESKISKQTDDLTPSLSSGTDTIIKPPPLVSIDLDSLSEEAAPLQTSDGGIVPPAPPLP